jgi:hypothetical protein
LDVMRGSAWPRKSCTARRSPQLWLPADRGCVPGHLVAAGGRGLLGGLRVARGFPRPGGSSAESGSHPAPCGRNPELTRRAHVALFTGAGLRSRQPLRAGVRLRPEAGTATAPSLLRSRHIRDRRAQFPPARPRLTANLKPTL